MESMTRAPAGRRIARVLFAALLALVCTGCATQALVRVANGADEIGPVETAWAVPDGGVLLGMNASIGGGSPGQIVMHATAEDVAAAHGTRGPHLLGRDAVLAPGAVATNQYPRLVVGRVEPGFEWTAAEIAALRPPSFAEHAIVSGRTTSEKLRAVHVTRESAGELGLEPDPDAGSPALLLLLPVTLAVDAAVIVTAVTVVVLGALAGGGAFSRTGQSWDFSGLRW